MEFLRSKWAPVGLIVLFALLSYWRVAQCGFIWDDDDYVTENPVLRTFGGLASIWFEPTSLPQYYPLVHTTFWVEYHIWGLSAFGYHLVNVLLHGCSAFVLLRLGRRLAVPGILFAVLWFLVHPVNVESVAWITERKNVLSLLCYLLAAERWLRWYDDRDRRSYVIGSLWLLGALWSKTVTASLPAALLIVVWWRDAAISKRAFLGALPWFVVGAALGWFTVHLEATHVGAADAPWQLVGSQRFAVAGGACWFYFGSLLWPFHTCFNYPRWEVDPPSILLWSAPIAALLAVVGAWLLRAKIGRGPAATLLLFGGTLVPAIGFFDVYPFRYSFVADHFQYHASVGVIVAVSALAARLLSGRVGEPVVVGIGAAWLVVMAITTTTLLPQYDSFKELWTVTLEKNPRSSLSLVNLGGLATDAREFEKARDYLGRCLEVDPTSDEAYANLGVVEHLSGDRAAAKAHYLRALELADEPNTRNNLAVLAIEEGDPREAIRLTREAIAIDPEYLTAHATLGWALTESRKWRDAVVELQWVLARMPNALESRRRLARCLLALGDHKKAAGQALYAVKQFPADQDSRRVLAKAMARMLRQGPVDGIRQRAVQAIQQGGVDAGSILGLLAAELRDLGAVAHAEALSGK